MKETQKMMKKEIKQLKAEFKDQVINASSYEVAIKHPCGGGFTVGNSATDNTLYDIELYNQNGHRTVYVRNVETLPEVIEQIKRLSEIKDINYLSNQLDLVIFADRHYTVAQGYATDVNPYQYTANVIVNNGDKYTLNIQDRDLFEKFIGSEIIDGSLVYFLAYTDADGHIWQTIHPISVRTHPEDKTEEPIRLAQKDFIEYYALKDKYNLGKLALNRK